MEHKHSIVNNTVWHLSEMLIHVLCPIATYPYATRVLGPEGIGRYSFAASLVGYFALLAGLGLPIYGMRCCAACGSDREKLTRTAAELLLMNLLTAAVAALLLLGTSFCVPVIAEDRQLFFLLGLTILSNCLEMEWLFRAEEQYGYLTVIRTVSRLLSLVMVFLAVRSEGDVIPYAATGLVGSCVSVVSNLAAVRLRLQLPIGEELVTGLFGPKRKALLRDVLKHLRPAALFFMMSCVVSVYSSMDTVMMGFLCSAEEVGLYDVGNKVKGVMSLFSTALWHVALPRSTRCWRAQDRAGFVTLGVRSLHAVLVIQMPAAIFLALLAVPCVTILAGIAYDGAVLPLRILCLSILPIGLSNVIGGQLLIPMGRERSLFHAECAGAASNLLLNLVFIPRFGAVGAAATTLFSELLVTVWAVCALHREFPATFVAVRDVLRMSVCTCSGAFLCWLALRNTDGKWNMFLIGAAVFFGVYSMAMLLLRDELFIAIWRKLGGKACKPN